MFKQLTAIIGVGVIGFFGLTAYSLFREPEAASGAIEAVPVQVQAADGVDSSSPMPALAVYQISQSGTKASFSIDEVLRGSPKTVVGTTDQVAGQISIDPEHPSTATVGAIQINARALTTDDSQRNNIMKNEILKTNQNQYITFTPTEMSGLPDSAAAGQAYSFILTGDLTIAGVTHPATFDVTVTPVGDGTLQGEAISTIRYTGWGLNVPSVPFVAGVGNEAQLKLDFMASR